MDAATPPTSATGERSSALSLTRIVAGGLLVAMSCLYVAAVMIQAQNPLWGYARAFAEAAMVGGLADWFAVTAIFRRPLGLPIPHTAVIPRSKERIADALGEFVAVNFLAPTVIATRLQNENLALALGRQLSDPQTARRIADGVIDALPGLADVLDDEVVADFMLRQLSDIGRDKRVAPMVGRGLRLLTEGGRHQMLLDAALEEGWRALEENESVIREQVRSRTSWVWRLIALDQRAADALISSVEDLLRDIARDPAHPARERITEMLHRFADELQNSPALRTQVEAVIADTLAHPAVSVFFGELWRSLKDAVRDMAQAPQSGARDAFADAIERFGAALLDDAEVQETLNRRMRVFLSELAGRNGRDIGALISETIRSWDTQTVVEKLEQNVGADLQYIRINGTVIGGLIGLGIHQLTLMIT